jgi:hypothetical protein
VPGIADLFYLGQPDPARQLAQALQGQQQPPPAAAPQGAAPPGTPTGGAAADPNAAPNPNPGAPSPGQPQALQSPPAMAQSYQALANPPNLMSLYLQLDQRDRAENQINHGLALIAANHSSPSMARNIMDSVNGGNDAGSTVNNLMGLYQGQQQMQANQQLMAQAPDIAAKLGLPEAVVRAQILAGNGKDLVAKMEPTDQQRNITAEHDAFIKSGGSEDDWKNNYLPMIITGGIPGATTDMKSMALARTQWNADPANQGRPMPGYLTDPTKWGIYSKDLGDAKTSFNGMKDGLGKFINDLSDASNNPALDEITGGVAARGKGFIQGLQSGSAAYGLHTDLEGLAGTAKALAARGGPKGVGQNLAVLGANPDDFTNYGIGDFRNKVIAPKIQLALTAQANAYGAAGRLNEMPGYLKPYLDQMYQPGGDLDPGGGYKPFTPSKDPNLKQPDAAALAAFKGNMEHYGPHEAIQHLKEMGYDTSSLE